LSFPSGFDYDEVVNNAKKFIDFSNNLNLTRNVL